MRRLSKAEHTPMRRVRAAPTAWLPLSRLRLIWVSETFGNEGTAELVYPAGNRRLGSPLLGLGDLVFPAAKKDAR